METVGIIVGIIAGVVAISGGVVGFLGWLRRWLRRSRRDQQPEIGDRGVPRLSDLVSIERDQRWWQPTPRVLGKYLGIRCRSQTDQDIMNCRIRLESLEYWVDRSRVWIRPEWFNPLLLAWSFNDGGGSMQTIGAHANRTCDLVCYESKDASSATIIAAEERLRQANQLQFGKWQATLHIEADGCLPVTLQAVFFWEPENTQVGELRKLEFAEFMLLDMEGSPIGGV